MAQRLARDRRRQVELEEKVSDVQQSSQKDDRILQDGRQSDAFQLV